VCSAPTTTVYVHQHVDNIQINQIQNPPPQYDCFYQGQTWDFEAIAYSGNPPVDISNTRRALTWSSNNAGVVTTAPYAPQEPHRAQPDSDDRRVPRHHAAFASVSGTTSAPYPLHDLPGQSHLSTDREPGAARKLDHVDNGASIPINATVIDTLYNIAPAITSRWRNRPSPGARPILKLRPSAPPPTPRQATTLLPATISAGLLSPLPARRRVAILEFHPVSPFTPAKVPCQMGRRDMPRDPGGRNFHVRCSNLHGMGRNHRLPEPAGMR
jgi:hypothetical protein